MTNNPLVEKLAGYTIVLASGSPRRKIFLEELGVNFEIRLKPVEEVYPAHLKGEQISEYLAQLKASVFKHHIKKHEILVTSDTVVWHRDESLAKASSEKEAADMLLKLSGSWHDVITSVCFTSVNEQRTVNAVTKVKFKNLTRSEIDFYINSCQPYDKAGAYGIQEWLGAIGIEEIQGSYNNVVGLPTHLVYKTLMDMVST